MDSPLLRPLVDAPTMPRNTRLLTWLLTLAALASGVATFYTVFDSNNPLGPDPQEVIYLILGNLGFLLFLLLLVINRAISLWRTIRHSAGTTKLQRQILLVFSTLTIVPALVVAACAILFFHLGVQSWFNERVSTALHESQNVAESYLQEHVANIRRDAVSMASDVDQGLLTVFTTPQRLNLLVERQATLRSLTEGTIIHENRIIAQTSLSFALAFERMSDEKRGRADNGETVIWIDDNQRIRALVRLSSLPETYLLIGRLLDTKAIGYMSDTQGAVAQYNRLQERVGHLQVQFSIIFGLLVLLLLMLAIWYGILFAARLIVPIARLIQAAGHVSEGNYRVKVPLGQRVDEIATLIKAFNHMTDELERKHSQLLEANRQNDDRRRFIEAVLAGISAGVMAVDEHKTITLHNRAASRILTQEPETRMMGERLYGIFPEIQGFIEEFDKTIETDRLSRQIKIEREGSFQHLLVHLRRDAKQSLLPHKGYIVTFDDMSALVTAQRSAAWADVARRVAHEIKNPLTPIQLSAERLRKRYSPQIHEDLASYQRYVDTIIRHVGDIGRMVEEFVGFARMPAPAFEVESLETLLRKVVFSEKTAHPAIGYGLKIEAANSNIQVDERQMTRALTNLLKNAAEALEDMPAPEGESYAQRQERLRINVTLAEESPSHLRLTIEDNGPGFPTDLLERIMEPYVTTKEKGSGLGLAIVRKILEDHGAGLQLANRSKRGARISIILPRATR